MWLCTEKLLCHCFGDAAVCGVPTELGSYTELGNEGDGSEETDSKTDDDDDDVCVA